MKPLFLYLFLLFTLLQPIYGQQAGNQSQSLGQSAQNWQYPKQLSPRDADQQRLIWESTVLNHPKNGSAWLNYYLYTSRSPIHTPNWIEQQLSAIHDQAKKNINGQSAFALISYLQSLKADKSSPFADSLALMEAWTLADDKVSLYPYMVQFAVINGNKPWLTKYCQLMEQEKPLSPALLAYHKNVLRAVPTNGMVYASGINDLIPLAVVQQVYGFRKDVSLRFYRNTAKELPKNSYLCLSIGASALAGYPHASLYGLLMKAEGGTSIPVLTEILFTKMDWSFLDQKEPVDPLVMNLSKNYLPALLYLHRHFLKTKDNRQIQTRQWIDALAAYTGERTQVQHALSKLPL